MRKDSKFSRDCADEVGITLREMDKYRRDIEKFVDHPKVQVNQRSIIANRTNCETITLHCEQIN